HLDLGGHTEKPEVEQTLYAKPKKCSAKFIQGPLKGTWSYTYTPHKDGSTRLASELDYELTGLLRRAWRWLGSQSAAGIRSHGAAKPDGLFERGAGADPLPSAQDLRNGSSSSCSKRSWTAVRSSLTSAFKRSCEGLSETLTTRMRRSVVCSAYRPAGSLPVM